MEKTPKRPRDLNQLAKFLVDQLTGDSPPDGALSSDAPSKDPAAVSLGRKGGLKGGAARAKALTDSQRSEIARKAARARWKPK
jgi:hypothetical protein